MHPASSIIVFTTLSGAGFGMMFWLGLGFGSSEIVFGAGASILALGLASAGLLASLWHLGNPQRAWRALSQWRSSWLSREGVLAIAALGAFGLYALAWIGGFGRIAWLGVPAALLAAATVYATSMIYASIQAVPHWSKSPTPELFLSFAAAGGALAVYALDVLLSTERTIHAGVPVSVILIASILYLRWTGKTLRISLADGGSTPETATGLGRYGRVRLLEAPHTSENYLMKEMVFRIGRKRATALRRLAFGAAFAVPFLLAGLGALAPGLSLLTLMAIPVHLAGVAASRWLFFAEAQHAVSLYYSAR